MLFFHIFPGMDLWLYAWNGSQWDNDMNGQNYAKQQNVEPVGDLEPIQYATAPLIPHFDWCSHLVPLGYKVIAMLIHFDIMFIDIN